MAITRRQFVTRLGALAAAAGLGQSQLLKITEAMGYGFFGAGKPKVLWVHGAECTGCSTSLLSLYEDATGLAVEDTRLTAMIDPAGVSTLDALGLVVTPAAVPRTLHTAGANVDTSGVVVNIADVLIDVIDLQYHETVMGAGGDLAYQKLAAEMASVVGNDYFVLVVEGAVQVHEDGGAWGKDGIETSAPWCAVGMNEAGTEEARFDDVVKDLAARADCLAVISIGQCACFGGYPACVSPAAEFGGMSQTPAYGVYDYLANHSGLANAEDVANKVINVPGCPTNPWWFVLTVVLYLADLVNGPLMGTPFTNDGPLGILNADTTIKGGVDGQRRLKAVYGIPIHGPACPRYKYSFSAPGRPALYASKPGDEGCLALIGCKGLSTNSLCSMHGWNNQQPHNDGLPGEDIATIQGNFSGGFCVTAGHPCMGCTEKGYPDAYVPFINKR